MQGWHWHTHSLHKHTSINSLKWHSKTSLSVYVQCYDNLLLLTTTWHWNSVQILSYYSDDFSFHCLSHNPKQAKTPNYMCVQLVHFMCISAVSVYLSYQTSIAPRSSACYCTQQTSLIRESRGIHTYIGPLELQMSSFVRETGRRNFHCHPLLCVIATLHSWQSHR